MIVCNNENINYIDCYIKIAYIAGENIIGAPNLPSTVHLSNIAITIGTFSLLLISLLIFFNAFSMVIALKGNSDKFSVTYSERENAIIIL